jgi:cold shock CspA family protein
MSEFQVSTDIVRTTVGKVLKYSIESGYGFIKLADDKWNDAFVSYREIEPGTEGLKKLFPGNFVELDLHKNAKGFYAKNVRILTEEQYIKRIELQLDTRFNK